MICPVVDNEKKPTQSWRDIAKEACREKDPKRLNELTEKLLEELEKAETQKKRKSA